MCDITNKTKIRNYKSTLAYIEQFIDYERSADFSRQARFYNLNRITQLLDLLGNPHERLKVIHVAGSKGKGSTAAIIASVLTHAGFKTGLYTSPHLITPRERCRIDGNLISESEITTYINKLKPAIETVSKSEFGRVSFFEIYTALAFVYFAEQETDFAVIEVGLGGRLDATNVVSPVVSVITPIGLEHTTILGKTYTEIAAEKAEIIKQGCPIALAPQHPDARSVINKVANERNASIVDVNEFSEDNQDTSVTQTVKDSDFVPIAQKFDVETPLEHYKKLKLPLLGQHQYVNALTAIAGIECLKKRGFQISKESVYAGFENVQWHGRIQRIMSTPLVLLDGAHSPVSMDALCKTIRDYFRYNQVIFVVSILKDKELSAIGEIVSQIADFVIATQVTDNPRVLPADTIQSAWSGICKKTTQCPTPDDAISKALSSASSNDLICISGSLYLVGQALKYFNWDYE